MQLIQSKRLEDRAVTSFHPTKSLSNLAHSTPRHPFSTSRGATREESVLSSPWAGQPTGALVGHCQSRRREAAAKTCQELDVRCENTCEAGEAPSYFNRREGLWSISLATAPRLASCWFYSLSTVSSISWNRPLPGWRLQFEFEFELPAAQSGHKKIW